MQQHNTTLARQYQLGLMHVNGQVLTKSDEHALHWFTKSANQEYAKAQYYLGVMNQHGRGGLDKNHEESMRWYHLAANQGKAMQKLNLTSDLFTLVKKRSLTIMRSLICGSCCRNIMAM